MKRIVTPGNGHASRSGRKRAFRNSKTEEVKMMTMKDGRARWKKGERWMTF